MRLSLDDFKQVFIIPLLFLLLFFLLLLGFILAFSGRFFFFFDFFILATDQYHFFLSFFAFSFFLFCRPEGLLDGQFEVLILIFAGKSSRLRLFFLLRFFFILLFRPSSLELLLFSLSLSVHLFKTLTCPCLVPFAGHSLAVEANKIFDFDCGLIFCRFRSDIFFIKVVDREVLFGLLVHFLCRASLFLVGDDEKGEVIIMAWLLRFDVEIFPLDGVLFVPDGQSGLANAEFRLIRRLSFA